MSRVRRTGTPVARMARALAVLVLLAGCRDTSATVGDGPDSARSDAAAIQEAAGTTSGRGEQGDGERDAGATSSAPRPADTAASVTEAAAPDTATTLESDVDPDQTTVADTRFSHDRGFYDVPFDVRIESKTPGARIGWTLDGSDPRESASARVAASPVVVRIDPASPDGRTVTPGVVLRAFAARDGLEPTDVDTQTYLFLESVLRQPAELGAGWPTYPFDGAGGPSVHDYAMDPRVVDDPSYTDDLRAGLREIPSLSIVMPPEEFWAMYRSTDVEHDASIELLFESTEGGSASEPSAGLFEQIDGAVEAHSHDRTKRSLRVAFRPDRDGAWRTQLLRTAPATGASAPDEVARLVLRGGNNRSWARSWNPGGTAYTVDSWYRATQQALSGYGAHGTFVHLYINGIYWGLYNPVERPDRHFAARVFGGDDDEWSAVSHGGSMGGSTARWDELLALVGGSVNDEATWNELQTRLDVDAFADSVLLAFYIGIRDWPGNNWWAVGRTVPPGPFRFVAWDGEWSFGNGFGSPDRPTVHPDFETNDELGGADRPPIERVFLAAMAYPAMRMRFADRAERALSDGGALSDARARERWAILNEGIRNAVVAESARWGDALRDGPLRTRDTDWQREVKHIDDYMHGAAEAMRNDLVRHGYYPSVDGERPFRAPVLELDGLQVVGDRVAVTIGGGLRLVAPEGSPTTGGPTTRILYALDGDPFGERGTIREDAREAEDGRLPPPARTTRLVARQWLSLPDGRPLWSPPLERLLVVPQDRGALRISEIHYHPPDGAELEFLELHNAGTDVIDLGALAFVAGVEFVFPVGAVLAAGAYQVVAADPTALAAAGGPSTALAYSGRLNNGGETIRLVDGLGDLVLEMTYDDARPWPESADGEGRSLVIAASGDAASSGSDPATWTASASEGGSPGARDPRTR